MTETIHSLDRRVVAEFDGEREEPSLRLEADALAPQEAHRRRFRPPRG